MQLCPIVSLSQHLAQHEQGDQSDEVFPDHELDERLTEMFDMYVDDM